uniref:Uncharacterized protein n=1 Tax=Varanus komodoensis TaxID=61221 RepID=A0A8D2J657_VARKO
MLLIMADNLEDSYYPSTNSLYEPVNKSGPEETALLEEPLGDRYDFCKPDDHWNSTYIIFFLLGTSSLLPLNFIITAKHYWIYKFQNCSEQISPEEQGASDVRVSVANLHFNFAVLTFSFCEFNAWILCLLISVVVCTSEG